MLKVTKRKIRNVIADSYYKTMTYLDHGTTDLFRSVEIETITWCNRTCSYCPNSKFDRGLIQNKKEMSIELFQKIIDDLKGIDYRFNIKPHFYGEPLLDNRLEELMRYTKKQLPKCKITIVTNGDLLDIERFYTLIDAGVDLFLVTQHGETMPKKFYDLLDTLKGSKLRKTITFRGRIEEDNLFNRGGLVQPKNEMLFKTCDFPSKAMVIDYQGNVVLCCNDYHSSIVLGNLVKENLMSIWNKESNKQLRQNINKGVFDLEICRKCVGIN